MGWSGSRRFLQDVDSIYDIVWAVGGGTGHGRQARDVWRDALAEEEQFSAYSFDYADVAKLWEHLRLYEAECLALLERAKGCSARRAWRMSWS
jgi:glycyl-tRNA synthetase alpha chain